MGARSGGGASGGMGSGALRTAGGTLQSHIERIFGKGADVEGIGKIALAGEIAEIKVDRDTPAVKHLSYKFKGQDSPQAHPSLRPANKSGWHGLTYAKDAEGWYVNDFS